MVGVKTRSIVSLEGDQIKSSSCSYPSHISSITTEDDQIKSSSCSYPSHISPITTVACSGHTAASSCSDGTIHLYDLPSASSLDSLLDHNHTASITALSFYTPSSLSFPCNLISAASDGSVAIFDTEPFVLLKFFRPHKKAVNDLVIHPSGKLALAV
ncbi:unnamed protein product [Eruca vesicaria subsp. sativa]|uniref:Uncharacterized protein n=1 Tax=Eruca vesicaria subsp. sativa TaxID=29727 RepID=A0ABC8IX14_ERUVS|nr:unnamed protein product [Eruca vesicaria subsp. sativa]